MATITEIKRAIDTLSPAQFQEFCDSFLVKEGYDNIVGLGTQPGTGNTTKGTPDSYCRNSNGKYVFVEYTIQKSDLFKKIKGDIEKCLDSIKSGLPVGKIEEIIYCHTSSTLKPGEDDKLHEMVEEYDIKLTIMGIDPLANAVLERYPSLCEYLNLEISTHQLLSIKEFVECYNANKMAAPLDTVFQYRNNEKKQIEDFLAESDVVIVTGKAGVGKTRLVLESVQDFAIKNGYHLLCVKNNNQSLYKDLVGAIEQPGKYLFFVDDANELSDLNQILEYIAKKEVKVIVTVRDYVKTDVVNLAKKFTFPAILEIPSFTDEEIKGFLKENMNIHNEACLRKILVICEGNPRMAYMAGKLALKKNSLAAINNAKQLYDTYYGEYVHNAIGNDTDLCFTAGVLSVVKGILLENISSIQGLLNAYGISEKTFKEKIRQLSRMEVVEIQLDKVACISDQCLSNYMLYYVFVERKLMPLSTLMEIGFPEFPAAVSRSISTIYTLFQEQEVHEYCEHEILKAWDLFKAQGSSCYERFVKVFKHFRPEEAILLAQKNIEDTDLQNAGSYSLDLLKDFEDTEYMENVLELFLDFCSKTEGAVSVGCEWLKNNYGINHISYKHDYHNQICISNYLYNEMFKEMDVAREVAYQWAKYSLGFSFNSAESVRGNKALIYTINPEFSEGLREYRSICWKILITLAESENWKNRVLTVLSKYAGLMNSKVDKSILIEDAQYVEQLLNLLKNNKLSYCRVVRKILNKAEKNNLPYTDKWSDVLLSEEWKLYQLLDDSWKLGKMKYDQYEEYRRNRIAEYSKMIRKEDMHHLLHLLDNILSEQSVKAAPTRVYEGIELLVKEFDAECLKAFLDEFILHGQNINIQPEAVLGKLNTVEESKRLLSVIEKADFPQKHRWMCAFFNTLPIAKADEDMLQEALAFIHEDLSDKDQVMIERQISWLDKFLDNQTDIYPVVFEKIFENHDIHPKLVESYLSNLFWLHNDDPSKLLSLFHKNIALLQEMYLYMWRKNLFIDYRGTILISLLSSDRKFINEWSKVFWQNMSNADEQNWYMCSALWESNIYMDCFDSMFNDAPKEGIAKYKAGTVLKGILTNDNDDEVIKDHKLKWLKHVIEENAFSGEIEQVFYIVCELDADVRRECIKTFLENNSDFDTFNKILIIPMASSWLGSCVPLYQTGIDFYESLYPFVSGTKFLKHKNEIRQRVERLKDAIKQEEVHIALEDLHVND